ncbi:molybdenum ABC transporter ATP-binding protein [Denitromonas ohlonensis]|uniref:Molybdenum ABC transporter ATP-binding protein n=2 Tax=Denitromonas TaxID=139331 RepID=A0A558E8Y5_9RHOO|nr:molybdenum ABC transporter ATP-binding protein [Denitromonas ohlonensis]TVT44590.1 MAG: molybdenum ABC transporter ATP-binding protein [Denitromonas halophila]TVO63479.1 molybdenum ABC transporter ATP-binding protein [Denitromonas ohlonensis]TVO75356.1 molybdenum ABC transporter ATP-binding protein [Denitromonas ohlonensis]TVT68014.1 MAG: molybdenum ABC transporter ATP-binding protein [Denitromonas halophila]TVT69831.1 MAG: molybdenum ABC transporter ATP-binding protein [Denitromonas haloph
MNHDGALHFDLALDLPQLSIQAAATLPPRGVTALFGPSGSGKTTLLRMIAGLESGGRGQIRLGDTAWQDDAATRRVPTHQRELAYVFQEASLFAHLTVRDNLAFGLKRARSTAHTIRFDDAVAWLGVGHLLDRAPSHLSGGERQRVAIARALLAQPRLLLMDEPLSAVDADGRDAILDTLEQLPERLGIPIIYVSHSIEEVARLADHLLLMSAGRLIADGPTNTILTRCDLPLAHGAHAGAVVQATVRHHNPAHHLSTLAFAGGELIVSAVDRPIGAAARARIAARDIAISLHPPADSSVLNHLQAQIVEVSDDPNPAHCLVRLQVGETHLLARITRLSRARLDLHAGKHVWALVKGVAVR